MSQISRSDSSEARRKSLDATITGTTNRRRLARSEGSDSSQESDSLVSTASSSASERCDANLSGSTGTSREKPVLRQRSHPEDDAGPHSDPASSASGENPSPSSSLSLRSSSDGPVSGQTRSREDGAPDSEKPAQPVPRLTSTRRGRSRQVASKRKQYASRKVAGQEKLDLSRLPLDSLRMSIRNNNLERAGQLVRAEIDGNPEWKTVLGQLLLDMIVADNLPAVLMLLDCGVPVDKQEKLNWGPLHCACSHNREKVALALMRAGADVNATDWEWSTPLMYACCGGNLRLVRSLLRRKATIDQAAFNQETALRYAAYNGHADVVRLLLRHGAPVIDRANNMYPAFQVAIYRNNLEMLKLLMASHGKEGVAAYCEFIDAAGVCALAYAAMRPEIDIKIIDYLCRHTLSGREKKFFERHPLTLAIILGRQEVAIRLIDRRWCTRYGNAQLLPPLITAAQYKKIHVLVALLRKDADCRNVTDNAGRTALIAAVQANNLSGTYRLIVAGADTSLADNKQKTALVHALDGKVSSAIVDLLLLSLLNFRVDLIMLSFASVQQDMIHLLDSLDRLDAEDKSLSAAVEKKKNKFIRKLCMDYRFSHLASSALADNLQRFLPCWRQFGGKPGAEREARFGKQIEMVLWHAAAKGGKQHEFLADREAVQRAYLNDPDLPEDERLQASQIQGMLDFGLYCCEWLIAAGQYGITNRMNQLFQWLEGAAHLSRAQIEIHLAQQIGLHPQVISLFHEAWFRSPRGPLQRRMFAEHFLAELETRDLEIAIAGLEAVEFELVDSQIKAIKQGCLRLREN